MRERSLPNVSYLQALFEYRDGKLFWKPRPAQHFVSEGAAKCWNSRYPGTEAGTVKRRELQVAVDGKLYRLHRILWAVVKGEHPQMLLDHINGDPFDNRIENLRKVTHQQNCINSVKGGSGSKELPKGVYRRPDGRYAAQIKADGVHFWLGLHDTPEQAHAVYRDVHEIFWGEYSCTEVTRG